MNYLILLFISSVCVYDIYCTVKYSDHLYLLEENPIANSLIEYNYSSKGILNNQNKIFRVIDVRADVSNLILVKVFGLLFVNHYFLWAFNSKKKIAIYPLYIIASLQFILLLYLVI